MGFIATINTPGYLPQDDDEHLFASAQEAWAFLADERECEEDDADIEYKTDDPDQFEYSDVLENLRHLSDTAYRDIWDQLGSVDRQGEGTIYGHTPGRRNDALDLGVAYTVMWVDREPEN